MTQALQFENVSFVRNSRDILKDVTWEVKGDERWVILGPNGAGKTTLFKLATGHEFPTSGRVSILGSMLGKVDVFELRNRVGFASSAQAVRIPGSESVRDVVMTAAYGVEGRWKEEYEEQDVKRANRILNDWDLLDFANHKFSTLSDGERKRALIARAVMTDPELLLLDEPTASLDLGAREGLLKMLSGYATSPFSPAMILVTHHVEEIPVGFTHVLMLKEGAVVAQGPIMETLTEQNLTETFSVPVTLTHTGGRYSAASHQQD